MQKAISYMQFRGGSSKGLYFLASDLPNEKAAQDKILLAAMCGVGGDDLRQIDGLGGADPLTSKVAIIKLSSRPNTDIEYEFVQIVVGAGITDRTQNCGNLLAGVVPFAIESGLIKASDPKTVARVYMTNSESSCAVTVQTPDKRIEYQGSTRIDGVPGSGAPVICHYIDTAGSACGSLFPTGNLTDEVNGINVTCIDNGMPVIIIPATSLGRSGYETRDELNADNKLKKLLEEIRLALAGKMNLGNVTNKVIPKISLISTPLSGGMINTRTFIPHVCHAAIGVLGAVSVATACVIPGTVAEPIAKLPTSDSKYSVEHPSGEFTLSLTINNNGILPRVEKAGVIRTARLISRGEVFIPDNTL